MKEGIRFFIFVLIGIVLFASFCFAAHVILSSLGANNFQVTSTGSYLFNISINITDAAFTANITQVNVTLPASFSFTSATNGSSANQNHTFITSGNTLSWTNTTLYLMNATNGTQLVYFWFNATTPIPGVYNITVITLNATGSLVSNLTVVVNDTTPPYGSYVAPGTTTQANLSRTFVLVNLSVSDNSSLGIVIWRLFNASGIVNTTTGSYGAPSSYVNFSNLSQGTYFINASFNDSRGNINATLENLFVVLDTTGPSVTFPSVDEGQTTLNITVGVSDSLSGVITSGSCNIVSGGEDPVIGISGATQYLSDSGLDCNTYYAYNVSCTDYAGNSGYGFVNVSTDGCSSSGGSGGGGGSSGGATGGGFWTNTFVSDSQELASYGLLDKQLSPKQRLRIKIDDEEHFVGVISISNGAAVLNVSSTSQQALFSIGSSKKFDVDDDIYYDLVVNVTNITLTKVSFTLYYIHELEPTTATNDDSLDASADVASNSSESISSGEQGSTSLPTWLGFVIAIAVFVIGVAAWFVIMRIRDKQQAWGKRV